MNRGNHVALLFVGEADRGRLEAGSRTRTDCGQGRGEIVGILSWIVFGLIAGLIAKWIMPGNDPGGFIVTILIGVAGAVIGGFLASALGYGGVDGFNLGSFFIAVVGSIVLLMGYRLMRR
jgi:uncharacterized membrane protein YeaQ/YmgE (transglycosylase-associated protein family)